MSADSRTVCPACHPDLKNYTGPFEYPSVAGVIDHAAEELGYDRSVRENFEFYMQATPSGIVLVSDYRADCWDCGWHWENKHTEPIGDPNADRNDHL